MGAAFSMGMSASIVVVPKVPESTPAPAPRCAQCGEPLPTERRGKETTAPPVLCRDCALADVPHTD
jgi:hypothetical protein